MSLTAWSQPKFLLNHLGLKTVNLSTDSFRLGLIASGTLAGRGTTQGYEFVSDLLANGGSALTEAAGTGYSRLTLTGVTWTLSGLSCVLTCASPSYASPTFSFRYGWVHDETASSATDATRPLVALIDFGQTFTASGTSYPMAVGSGGLLTLTAGA